MAGSCKPIHEVLKELREAGANPTQLKISKEFLKQVKKAIPTYGEIGIQVLDKKRKNWAYGKEVEKLSNAELQDLIKESKNDSDMVHIIVSDKGRKIQQIQVNKAKEVRKDSIDNLTSIPEVKELVGSKEFSSYSKYIIRLIDKIKKPDVSYSDTVAFSGEIVKGLMNGVVNISGGVTDKKGNVKLATSKVPDSEVYRIAVEWYLEGTEEGKRITDMNEEDGNAAMLNNKELNKFVDEKQKELAVNLLEAVKNINGAHSLTHEMIHVGAKAFMDHNPEHPATKKILAIYKEALDKRYSIFTSSGETYWVNSVDEFIAEALSNPALAYTLNQITTSHGDTMLSKMFTTIIDTLLNMLGFVKNDSVYQHVLDGFTAMLEAQSMLISEEINAKPSSVDKVITDLFKEDTKPEADIITPNNIIKRALACSKG
jgi:hypothetical protein